MPLDGGSERFVEIVMIHFQKCCKYQAHNSEGGHVRQPKEVT